MKDMKRNKIKLSVVLATHNEEKYLGNCLDSVKDIADEIVVVDGASTDDTLKIARTFNARVISTTNKKMFHINKQKAIDAAKGHWILQLDADEVVSKPLAKEIKTIINMSQDEIALRKIDSKKKKLFEKHEMLVENRDGPFGNQDDGIVAFFTPRSSRFLGRILKHGGVYPDGVIRLIKNGKARFPCKSVHEQIEIDGNVAWLQNDLIHYNAPTFKRYITNANRYTSLTAQQLMEARVSLSIFQDIKYLVFKPCITFLSLYFRHRGYKDGFPGFVFALFSGLHHAMAYMKLGDLYRYERSN